MSVLLKLLLSRIGAYLFPNAGTEGVADPEPPEDDAPPEDEGIQADAEDDGAEDNAEEPEGDQPAAKPPSRAQREIIALRERAQKVERELEEIRSSARQPAPVNPLQRQIEDEERKLSDPNTDPMERWQIQANRQLRDTQANTAAALAQAQDARDAAQYERKAASQPLYDKYRDRVEELVLKERKLGRLVNREDVLTYLIGKDMLAGNLKSTKAAAKPNVPRGKPVAARSDVPRRGTMTEHQKRIARLQDQPI